MEKRKMMPHSWEEPMQEPNPQNRIAPKGQYRLLCVDTFEGPFAEAPVGNFPTVDAALAAGTKFKRGQSMMKYYVYDDQGKFIAEADPREHDAPFDEKDTTAAKA